MRKKSKQPEIGKEISWAIVIGMVFRVLDFNKNGTVLPIGGLAEDVKAKSKKKPYGYLLVESPVLNQPVLLPIIHNNDFWLASSVFDDPEAKHWIENPNAELLVVYAPKHEVNGYSASPHHVLHYVITPKGTLDRYYNKSAEKIAQNRYEPELLFGPFIYEGAIRVQMNPKLQL